jgi:hypothetical protein
MSSRSINIGFSLTRGPVKTLVYDKLKYPLERVYNSIADPVYQRTQEIVERPGRLVHELTSQGVDPLHLFCNKGVDDLYEPPNDNHLFHVLGTSTRGRR